MTTEEKAERYDKSFERAKEQLNGAKVFDYDNEQIAHDIRTTVYNIFPELKSLKDRVGCEVNYTTTSEPVVRENKGNYGEISPNSEWSEEDESMRRHLVLILMELGLSRVKYSTVPKYHFDREIEWLCNLHPQPKEEWSKKDEAIKLAWLKSLFPQKQWKPSEEQIEILNMVLTNESMDDNVARILRELREQLKKLREE